MKLDSEVQLYLWPQLYIDQVLAFHDYFSLEAFD